MKLKLSKLLNVTAGILVFSYKSRLRGRSDRRYRDISLFCHYSSAQNINSEMEHIFQTLCAIFHLHQFLSTCKPSIKLEATSTVVL
jgi:hypothetical protein